MIVEPLEPKRTQFSLVYSVIDFKKKEAITHLCWRLDWAEGQELIQEVSETWKDQSE